MMRGCGHVRYGAMLALAVTVVGASPAAPPPDPPVEEVPHGTGQRVGAGVADRLRSAGVPDGVTVALVATLPIVELRGAIPVGNNYLGMRGRWWATYAWAVLGNLLPVPFILGLLGPVSRFCMRWKPGRIFFEWLFARTRRRAAGVERYETLGLTLFVAVPLPVTGAWTGAVAAFLMGLTFPHAMAAITLGVLIAGVVVTVLSLLGWAGALVAAVVLCGLAVGALSRMLR